MARIFYLPDEKEIEVGAGETILQASLRAGIPHAHACGGDGRCSTCFILVLEGLKNCTSRNAKEQTMAERLHFDPTIRMACQTTITGNVKLRRLVLDDTDVELTNQLRSDLIPGSIGKEKQVAILFADIREFTAFAEKLVPYDVIYVLNRYFLQMGQVITRNGGYIDNYMGDGLLALFGVKDFTGTTLKAVKAGLEMLEAMEKVNQYLNRLFKRRLQINIGVHYGEVVVGMIGASGKKRETAIGDAVNFASRIEVMNKQMGTRLLISQEAYEQVKEQIRVGKQIKSTVRGKKGEYTLYEVIGLEGLSS